MSEFNMKNIKAGSIADIALRTLSQKSAGQAIIDVATYAIFFRLIWRIFVVCCIGILITWIAYETGKTNVENRKIFESEYHMNNQDAYDKQHHLGIYKYLGYVQ